MDYKRIYIGITRAIEADRKNIDTYEDGFTLLRQWQEADLGECKKYIPKYRALVARGMQIVSKDKDYDNAEKLRQMIYELYKMESHYSFDSYCLALEYKRPVREQFYYPRREILKEFVDELQRLYDGEIQELFLSCPPRVGKTTLLLFYTTWIMGTNPNASNLYSSFSSIITDAFYNGVMEIVRDTETYNWQDIFPECKVPKDCTNAANTTIDINRKKHYPSLTCRSLYGTLNGACDCNGILIGDDLIGGIEEALNKDRLISAWSKVDNNLIPRAKESAKILWCGTRWSIADPAGLRMSLLEEDPTYADRKYVICNRPAMDENDESNFDYKFGVGFSTAFYRQRRASFERNGDTPSWSAQYMCTPVERDGTVFDSGELRYYDGNLPEGKADRIFMAVDPAFGGGDFTASPICYQYGEDIYVVEVVYSNKDKTVTIPDIVTKCRRYGVGIMELEANRSLQSYVEELKRAMHDGGCRTTVQTHSANTRISKEQRIFDRAPDIREHYLFLESGHRSKEYELFMQNVFSFKIEGKNKHDDAPDSLAMSAEMTFRNFTNQIRIFKRPF